MWNGSIISKNITLITFGPPVIIFALAGVRYGILYSIYVCKGTNSQGVLRDAIDTDSNSRACLNVLHVMTITLP